MRPSAVILARLCFTVKFRVKQRRLAAWLGSPMCFTVRFLVQRSQISRSYVGVGMLSWLLHPPRARLDGRMETRGIPVRTASREPDTRLRQPEGRRRQDDDRGQSRRPPSRARRSGLRRRPGPAGQCDERLRHRRASVAGSIYDALVDGRTLARLDRRDRRSTGCDIVPAAIALAGAEVELAMVASRERRLARALADVARSTTTASSSIARRRSGLLTVNALTAADAVLVPIQCEYYALEGSEPVDRHGESRP